MTPSDQAVAARVLRVLDANAEKCPDGKIIRGPSGAVVIDDHDEIRFADLRQLCVAVQRGAEPVRPDYIADEDAPKPTFPTAEAEARHLISQCTGLDYFDLSAGDVVFLANRLRGLPASQRGAGDGHGESAEKEVSGGCVQPSAHVGSGVASDDRNNAAEAPTPLAPEVKP